MADREGGSMKGFTIYSFYTGMEGGGEHFATLAHAKKRARELLDYYAEEGSGLNEIEIEKHQTVPMTKDNLIGILNTEGGSWARESVVVATIKSRRSKGSDDADL